MKNWGKITIFSIACIVLVWGDRFTKQLAREHLMYSQPKSYFNNIFRFEYVENTGAALSFGDDLPQAVSFWLLSIVPLLVIVTLFGYVISQLNNFSRLKLFSFTLIIAGGLGNIIDRIMYDRHVTDFMNMGIGDLRTGIFNVADVYITAGVIGLFVVYLSKDKGVVKPDNLQDDPA